MNFDDLINVVTRTEFSGDKINILKSNKSTVWRHISKNGIEEFNRVMDAFVCDTGCVSMLYNHFPNHMQRMDAVKLFYRDPNDIQLMRRLRKAGALDGLCPDTLWKMIHASELNDGKRQLIMIFGTLLDDDTINFRNTRELLGSIIFESGTSGIAMANNIMKEIFSISFTNANIKMMAGVANQFPNGGDIDGISRLLGLSWVREKAAILRGEIEVIFNSLKELHGSIESLPPIKSELFRNLGAIDKFAGMLMIYKRYGEGSIGNDLINTIDSRGISNSARIIFKASSDNNTSPGGTRIIIECENDGSHVHSCNGIHFERAMDIVTVRTDDKIVVEKLDDKTIIIGSGCLSPDGSPSYSCLTKGNIRELYISGKKQPAGDWRVAGSIIYIPQEVVRATKVTISPGNFM